MSEWDQRTLCPDGACVGVIGADGTCKVCGRVAPNWGDERKRGLADETADEAAPSDEDDDEYEDDDEDDEDEEEDDGAEETESAGEWDDRKLCPDGGCVGLIGPNGTCNVCGRSAA